MFRTRVLLLLLTLIWPGSAVAHARRSVRNGMELPSVGVPHPQLVALDVHVGASSAALRSPVRRSLQVTTAAIPSSGVCVPARYVHARGACIDSRREPERGVADRGYDALAPPLLLSARA